MPIDTVSLPVASDLDLNSRLAIQKAEDEINRTVQQINDRALLVADTGSSGTGAVVLGTSPTLTTPTLSSPTLSTPTVSGLLTADASVHVHSGTAIPAGGTAGAGLKMSSTSNFGVFFGSGAPTLSAAKGSMYLRSNGSTNNNRVYINTDGGTTWTAITTAA